MLGRVEPIDDVAELMAGIGHKARVAAQPLSIASPEQKMIALIAMADAVDRRAPEILDANRRDMADGEKAGMAASLLDRLKLDAGRIAAISESIRTIAALKDPVGDIIAEWDRPNGLHIERVRTPLGVIGVIYES
ncbi:hypothetical protein LZC20_09540, partial [Campylobacter coli]|nr:hypothetical protein [Campylobacter coli]